MDRKIPQFDDVTQLLTTATRAAANSSELAERRRQVLVSLGEIVGADVGHWAWGRGTPTTSAIVPVAMIEFGYSPEQRSIMIEQALSEEGTRVFQQRAMKYFDEQRQLVVTRQQLIPDDEWRTTPHLVDHVVRLGLDAWMHSVRYLADDTWCCIHLMRNTGSDEFNQREAAILYLALAGVSWFHPQIEERVPAEKFVGLTARQRTVMLMQLDGLSRKEIAASLGVSEHTIDDHLKAIFKHFGVHTAIELAALFLRNV